MRERREHHSVASLSGVHCFSHVLGPPSSKRSLHPQLGKLFVESIACDLLHYVCIAPRRALCVCPSATATMRWRRRWQWPPPSSISSRSDLVPPSSSLAHSFVHSFIRASTRRSWFFATRPASVSSGVERGNERPLPRSPLPRLQWKQETRAPEPEQTAPFSGLNRRRRCVSVRVVLLARGGGAAASVLRLTLALVVPSFDANTTGHH